MRKVETLTTIASVAIATEPPGLCTHQDTAVLWFLDHVSAAGWLETHLRPLALVHKRRRLAPSPPRAVRRGSDGSSFCTEAGTLTCGWRNTCAAAKEQAEGVEDLYTRLKTLQRQLEFCDIQEEYIKDETKNLRRELLRAQEEVKRIQSVPLVIGQFLEMVDANSGIVGSTTGSNYYVRILSTLDRELLKPSASVALHRHSNALVDILPPEADSSISLMQSHEKPDVSYAVRCPPRLPPSRPLPHTPTC